MSQTKVFSVTADTVVRNKDDGTGGQGCGLSKHYYVGRFGATGSDRNYDSFIKFAYDWSGVKSITKAVLNIYTDEYDAFGSAGEPGLMPAPASVEHPKAVIYRLTSAFVEGNNVDGTFNSSDYTHPAYTTSGGVSALMAKGASLVAQIDITAIIKAHAPVSVGGGGKTNYGIGLYGSTDTTQNWSGWAREHTGGGGAAERATITLTYELGATTPNTPVATAPTGNIASLTTFDGVFSDPRPTDTLQSTAIEIYDGGHAGTAATSDIVTSTAHHLVVGDSIYFTSLTGGTGLSTFKRYYVRAATTSTFKVATTNSDSTIVDITVAYSALTWSKLVKSFSQVAPNADRVAYQFHVPKPTDFIPVVGSTYRYRVSYTDQEGQTSAWTALISFVLTNTAPRDPVLAPISGASFASLNLVKFQGGGYFDADGDLLQSHQIQLSPFAPGDTRWNEGDGILWDTGKVFESLGATSWTDYYGGRALVAGTYYWRARQFDAREGVSNWVYATIILTADFSPDPSNYATVQIDANAPWRILIRNLYLADGVTKTTGRAPGQLVAVLEEAKNVGASIVYNSPGELHFTLLKDDEQISVIEPKQVHYALEFYAGDGWQEKFAGVIWDIDATETDVVFKGIDYVALYDTVLDERYDPLKPNKSYAAGGSFYSNVSIRTVVLDQLNRAKALTDSWVGFIAIGSIATMNELVSVYSTMQPVLSFIGGLLDSHRQGTGKRTRMRVVKLANGTYELRIDDDPGVIRTDLAMYYGELVQGYRIIAFGDGWANIEHVVGRNREGSKVVYETISGQPFQPSTSIYGRIATVAVMDGVQDQNDLARRGLQAAIQSAKLGKNVAIGIRTQFFAPLQGYDVCDVFPLAIVDGAIDTSRFGSGFWCAMAVAWEATDIGEQSLVLTFMPREDSTAPNPDLIPSVPVSTQPEWQLGWVPPQPSIDQVFLSLDTGLFMDAGLFMDGLAPRRLLYYMDVTTGYVYTSDDDGVTWVLATAPQAPQAPTSLAVDSRMTTNNAGVAVVNLNVRVS